MDIIDNFSIINNQICLNSYKLVIRHYKDIDKKEFVDNEQYSYMSGLEVKTQDFNKEINEIASYGSKEAYEASLPQAQDEFNLDMDYRMSKMELGL